VRVQSLRLVIKDSKKHPGEKLVMAFAEYTNTYFATEAMDKLQVGGEEGCGCGKWLGWLARWREAVGDAWTREAGCC